MLVYSNVVLLSGVSFMFITAIRATIIVRFGAFERNPMLFYLGVGRSVCRNSAGVLRVADE